VKKSVHFSIITVTLDDLEGLKITRNSIENQTCKNWTHIIIHGGSSKAVKRYIANLDRSNTVYISELDDGIYFAMNKGLKLVTPGSYVFYLNVRDIIAYTNSLTFAEKAIKGKPNIRWIYSNIEEFDPLTQSHSTKLISRPSLQNQLYAYGYIGHQGTIMRKDLIEELGGFNTKYRIASDWDLIVRALKIESPTRISSVLGRFELGGLSSLSIVLAHQELIALRRKYGLIRFNTLIHEFRWRFNHFPQLGFNSPHYRYLRRASSKRKHKKSKKFSVHSISIPIVFGIKIFINFSLTRERTRRSKILRREILTANEKNIKYLALNLYQPPGDRGELSI
jgi:glycosyltransferase involved in cell wall biosynthesis